MVNGICEGKGGVNEKLIFRRWLGRRISVKGKPCIKNPGLDVGMMALKYKT